MANPPPPRANYQFKLVLLGESAVGKSSLVLRFVQNDFQEFRESTIGAAFLTQTVKVNDSTTVKFEIWDTAGQESKPNGSQRRRTCCSNVSDVFTAIAAKLPLGPAAAAGPRAGLAGRATSRVSLNPRNQAADSPCAC